MSPADDVFLDAHVHLHRCFDRGAFFAAALRNLRAAAGRSDRTAAPGQGRSGTATLGLMLTESRGVDAFGELLAAVDRNDAAGRRLRDEPGGDDAGVAGWSFARTGEDNSLWACRAGDDGDAIQRLLLVAGRQIVTAEGLEVLALGCRGAADDGGALRPTIEDVAARGGIPVVPWGFGKWWFGRGRLLADLLRADLGVPWFLGDNSGRPRSLPAPALLAAAAERGVFVLPGSDPLPFPRQVDKPGRCGFHLSRGFDRERPAASILAWLHECAAQPGTFGIYESIPAFIRDQVTMQVVKRRAATPPALGSAGDPRRPA